MKRIRLFFHRHRMIGCFLILFGFLFYLSYNLYKKEDLWTFEKVLKNSLAGIVQIVTPSVEVHYQAIVDMLDEAKNQELQELRGLLDLQNTSSFMLEHASVIYRNVSHYFNEITINKGKRHGIDQYMLAVNEKGLIGVVEYVTQDTATIKLLTVEDMTFKVAVAVYSGDNLYNGMITGYDQKTGEVLVTSIRSQSEIEIGSIVKTNGLGNLYPEGIEVGRVTSIEMDKVGVSKIIRIQSGIDFRNIRYVSIIKGVHS